MIRAAGIICKPIPEMVTAVVPELRRWLETRKIEVFCGSAHADHA